jgi:hypothetical protein
LAKFSLIEKALGEKAKKLKIQSFSAQVETQKLWYKN